MISFLPKLDLQGNVKDVFNTNDYDYLYGYVTFADLQDYANLYNANIFQSINYFNGGISFTNYINNVSESTFNFLSNVTSDIQTQFNNILTILTNYNYYSDTNTQTISTNLNCPNISTNDIESNTIKNNYLLSSNINTIILNSKNITCENIYSQNIPMVYLFNQNVNFPLIKSGLLSKLTGFDKTKSSYITIALPTELYFMILEKLQLL